MNPLLRFFRQWLALRSLRSQLLMTATGLSLMGLLVLLPVSLQSLQNQIEKESGAWASALATMAAHISGPLMEAGDHASIDHALEEFASLPGVVRVEVRQPGGLALLRMVRQGDGKMVVIRPRHEPATTPPDTAGRVREDGSRVLAYASLLAAHRGVQAVPASAADVVRAGR